MTMTPSPNTPDTPKELMEMNNKMEEMSWEEMMMEEVCSHSPSETYTLTIRMLTLLLKFHMDGVKEYMDVGDNKNTLLWMRDSSTLDNILTLLKDVDMG